MKSSKTFVVAIDGPSGVGKSTVARNLAKKLALIHLNSGALFRAVSLFAERQGISFSDEEGLAKLARSLEYKFVQNSDGTTKLLVGGEDVMPNIYTEAVGERASQIGVLPKVREVLLHVQRDAAKEHSIVVEGRDAGTVVFPDALVKLFMVAAPKVRAERRLQQLKELSGDKKFPTLEQVMEEMATRDGRDATRDIAPNVQAKDAILLDTSAMNIEQVLDKVCDIIKQRVGDMPLTI